MALTSPDWTSPYWEEFDENGESVNDPAAAMIDWLATQSPAIWHAFATQYMNWDNAEGVAFWILNQPTCDRATAAYLLFISEPDYYLDQYLKGEYQDAFTSDISHETLTKKYPEPIGFIRAILTNFKNGYYANSQFQQNIDKNHIAGYEESIQCFEPGKAPFEIPVEFFGPFSGEIAKFPNNVSPYYNKEMWALISALGTDVPNYESDKWWRDLRSARQKWREQVENSSLLTRIMWHPPLVIPHGPEFENEEERGRYISGDKQVSKTIFNRAKRKIRAQARGENNSEVKKALGIIAAMVVFATLVVVIMLALEGRLIS